MKLPILLLNLNDLIKISSLEFSIFCESSSVHLVKTRRMAVDFILNLPC